MLLLTPWHSVSFIFLCYFPRTPSGHHQAFFPSPEIVCFLVNFNPQNIFILINNRYVFVLRREVSLTFLLGRHAERHSGVPPELSRLSLGGWAEPICTNFSPCESPIRGRALATYSVMVWDSFLRLTKDTSTFIDMSMLPLKVWLLLEVTTAINVRHTPKALRSLWLAAVHADWRGFLFFRKGL